VRRAVLEASLRGRNDFQTAMEEFLGWLRKIEESVQSLDTETENNPLVKDAAYRRNWMEREKVGFVLLYCFDCFSNSI